MKLKNINYDLKIKVKNYLEYIWDSEKNQNIKETQEIINRLSKSLKEELLLHANGHILKNSPLLNNNFSGSSLRKIVYSMKEINMTPGDIVYYENDINDQNLYLVRDGEIELFIGNSKTTTLKILKKGQNFGELEFFSGTPRRTSARSLSFSSLFIINKEVFLNILNEISEDYERFCQIKDQINLNNNLNDLFINCNSCNSSNHSNFKCPLIHLTLSNNRIIDKYNFSVPQIRTNFFQRKKKKWNCLKNKKLLQNSALELYYDLFDIPSDMEKSSLSISREILQNSSKLEKNDDEISFLEPFVSKNSVEEIILQKSLNQDLSPKRIIRLVSLEKVKKKNERIEEEEKENFNKRLVKTYESINMDDHIFRLEKLACDIDSYKEYISYFPTQNISDFIEKNNALVARKQKRLKTIFNFYSFIQGSREQSKKSYTERFSRYSEKRKSDNDHFFKNGKKIKISEKEYNSKVLKTLGLSPKIKNKSKFTFYNKLKSWFMNLLSNCLKNETKMKS